MNCGAPSIETSFQAAKFLFEVQKASSLFCLVQNRPVVIWVACRGKIGGGSASVVVEKYEKANSIFNISVVILNKRLKFFPIFRVVY